MRFLHTADWQIGMRAAHAGEAGARVREERLAAVARVVTAAREHGAEFILVAGDVFEDNGVDRVLVRRVAEALGGFSGPVYLLPGNHDPAVPGSVWDHPAWRERDNLRVLRECAPVAVPGGTLYPCPLREKHGESDPTAWIDPAREHTPGGGIRIGMAHGTVDSVHLEEPDFPIERDAAERRGLDYLALGHWHSTATYPGRDGAHRVAYSGTHEPTRFGERDSGNVLMVDVAARGAIPVLAPVRTGGLRWLAWEEELRLPGQVAALRARVESVPDPGETLLRVRVTGVLGAAEHGELLQLTEVISARFLHGRIDAAALRPAPDDAGWIETLPPGVVREAARRIRRAAELTPEGGSPALDASPEVASWALMELFDLLQERAK